MPELEKKIQIEAVEGTDYAIPVLDASQVKNIDTYVEGKVSAGIATVIGGATEAMDTLKEVEDYINSTSGQGASGLIAQVNSLGDTVVGLQGDVQTLQGQMSSKANLNQIPDVSGFATKTELQTAIAGVSGGSGTSTPVVISGDSADVFKVNGEPHAEGEVVLEAQGTYTLSGKLHGHIIVGHNELTKYIITQDEQPAETSTKNYYILENGVYTVFVTKNQYGAAFDPGITYYEESQYDKTKLILDNFEIVSDRETAILYDEPVKSVELLLEKNTKNSVKYEVVGSSTELSSDALILSNNSLKILGLGELDVVNNFGSHAIKAKDELEISGKPLIVIDNGEGHDGLHGSNGIIIHNGKIVIKNAKDGLGTGDEGSVKIYAGELEFEDILESDIDSKLPGYIYNEDWVKISGAKALDGITVFNGFGPGSVKKSGTDILPVEGVYTLSGDTGAEFDLKGEITGIVLSAIETTNLVLDGVHLKGDLKYTAAKKRVSLELAEGTINIIDGSIISSNNIEIKGKGTLYVTSTETALEGSTVSIRGDGDKYIKAAEYSIRGTEVLIGDESSDPDILVAKDVNKDSDQNVYAGKVYARLNSDHTKKGVFVIYENQKGFVLLEKVQYEPLAGYHGNGINVLCDEKLVAVKKIEEKLSIIDGYDFAGETLEDGTYLIKNPVNSPFGGENGFIKVSKKSDGSALEEWTGEHFSGYRLLADVNPVAAGFSSLVINGTPVDVSVGGASNVEGVSVDTNAVIVKDLDNGAEVILEAGREYTLSGSLVNTRIRIAAGTSTSETVTTLNLDGLYILFNNFIDVEDEDYVEKRVKGWEPMIQSEALGKTTINLVEGSQNYLVREKEETMPDPDADGLYGMNHSTGVVYSTDGSETLEIKGSGFLSIKTMLGGHAFKAKGHLLVNGTPKIRAIAYHDILHGNASVTVNGGYIYAEWCNDFFGSDTADGDQNVGLITINSGDFYVKYCNETFLQGDNARVFPAMKLTFEHIGEGLWLQCKPGTRLFVEDGKIKGYFTLDYTNHTFVMNAVNKKGMKKVPGWAKEEFWTPIEFAAATDPYASLAIAINKTTTVNDVYGIVTYAGVDARISGPTAAPDYSEGNKGRTTPRATQAAAETTAPANELAVAMTELANHSEIFPLVEKNEYKKTIVTGRWVVNADEEKLNSEKNALKKSIKAVLSAIVPVKTLSVSVLRKGELLTQDDSETPVPFIAPDESITIPSTGKAVGIGKEVFSSKTGISPVIKLRKGEWVRIYAHIDPEDSTNVNLKWGCAYENENTVIYIRKSEDTQYCDVLGIDNGVPEGQYESVVLSAKGLDKDGSIVKMKVRFHVVPKENDYELEDLPEEKSELELLREEVNLLKTQVAELIGFHTAAPAEGPAGE